MWGVILHRNYAVNEIESQTKGFVTTIVRVKISAIIGDL